MYRNKCNRQVYVSRPMWTKSVFTKHVFNNVFVSGSPFFRALSRRLCVSFRRDLSPPDHSTRLNPVAIFCFRITLLPNFLRKLVRVSIRSDFSLPDHPTRLINPETFFCFRINFLPSFIRKLVCVSIQSDFSFSALAMIVAMCRSELMNSIRDIRSEPHLS